MKIRNYLHIIITYTIIILTTLTITMCNTIPESMLPKEDDDARTLLEKARNIYDQNAPQKAIEVYELLIEKYPNERRIVAWAYYEMGFILFDLKKWEEALEKFEIVVKEYKVDNKSAYIIAYKYFKRINYAFETGNMEVLKHNSSYAIPENYNPLKSDDENSDENNGTNNNDDENSDENNGTNNDDGENSDENNGTNNNNGENSDENNGTNNNNGENSDENNGTNNDDENSDEN